MNPTEKIISKANIKTEDIKLNILTFQTHERYEEQLCKTGHNFYAFNLDGMKQWNTKYAPMPENYVLMPESQIFDHVNTIHEKLRWGHKHFYIRLFQKVRWHRTEFWDYTSRSKYR